MVAKKAGKKKGKGQVKMLKLKRESIKNLSRSEKKKVKGGSGITSGVIQSRVV
ncbi:MAG: hypothetical protein AABM67_15805 [Acidobacteriota bacterium]